MLVGDLQRRESAHLEQSLVALRKHASTLAFRRKVSRSLRIMEAWRARCTAPSVSCGGGKDSSAVLLLAMRLGIVHETPIYRADPPNPLPDRPDYVRMLVSAIPGGLWRIVPYPWDVDAVLAGEQPYPALLKIRRLKERYTIDGIDGVALGLRTEESKGRLWLARTKGPIYKLGHTLMCCPILEWTAEEVLGFVLAEDRLPLNPVYHKLRMAPPLTYLRDGTWYPRETPDAHGHRDWLALHYPEVVQKYDLAVRLGKG